MTEKDKQFVGNYVIKNETNFSHFVQFVMKYLKNKQTEAEGSFFDNIKLIFSQTKKRLGQL